jgi:hypothetical protein
MSVLCEESRCIILGLLLLVLTLISSYYVKVWTPTTQTKVDVPLEIRKNKLFCPGFGTVSHLNDQWQPQLKVKPKKKTSFTKGKRQVVDEDNSLIRALSGKALDDVVDDVVTFEDDSQPEKPKSSTFFQDTEREQDAQHLFKQFSSSSLQQNAPSAGSSVVGPPSRTSMFEQQVRYPRIEAQDPMDRQTTYSHFGPGGGTLNQPQGNQTFNQTGTSSLIPYGSAATPYGNAPYGNTGNTPYGNAQGGYAQTYGGNQNGFGQQPQSFQQNSQINTALRNAQNDDQFLQTLRSLKTSSF